MTNGLLSTYMHVSPASGLGRIGVIVALEAGGKPIPSSSMKEFEVIPASSYYARHNIAPLHGTYLFLISLHKVYEGIINTLRFPTGVRGKRGGKCGTLAAYLAAKTVARLL